MPTLRGIGPYAVVAALGLASCKQQPPAPPNELPSSSSSSPRSSAASDARPPATPDVLALLGDLKAGEKLGPAVVLDISAVTHGTVALDLRMGDDRGSIFFVKVGDGPSAPASSEKYAVYYRDQNAPHSIAKDVLEAACSALAERLRKSERNLPAPAGLTGYPPEKMEPRSTLPI